VVSEQRKIGRPRRKAWFDTGEQPSLFAFVANAAFVPTKGMEPLMGTSWFSMEKTPRKTPITHEYKNYFVEISPGKHGIATYWDQDVLLFAISQLIQGIKDGREIIPKVNFTGYDFFRHTQQRWVGKKSYDALQNALRRLQSTTIRTNIKANGKVIDAEKGTSWITGYRTVIDDDGKTYFQIDIPDHLFDWVQNKRNWLTLDSSYFSIMGGVERFVYLWCRKAAGYNNGDFWEESFTSLYEKSGTTNTIIKFRYKLRQIIKFQSIPGYRLSEFKDGRNRPILRVERDIMHPLLITGGNKIRKKSLPKRDNTINQLPLFSDFG